jgi:hypothetical protein
LPRATGDDDAVLGDETTVELAQLTNCPASILVCEKNFAAGFDKVPRL